VEDEAMRYLTYEVLSADEWHREAMSEHSGASVEFLGVVRRLEHGTPIEYLEYEAYEPMAERMIEQYIQQAQEQFGLSRVYFRHRLGKVRVNEIAVIIGVHAPHRDQAFAGCQFLLEALKRDVPIWKVQAGYLEPPTT
jgi:molybdopterin synthase catalytic subunit